MVNASSHPVTSALDMPTSRSDNQMVSQSPQSTGTEREDNMEKTLLKRVVLTTKKYRVECSFYVRSETDNTWIPSITRRYANGFDTMEEVREHIKYVKSLDDDQYKLMKTRVYELVEETEW